VLAREEDHGGKSESNDSASEEGDDGVSNGSGIHPCTLVFDKKHCAYKDKGAEQLNVESLTLMCSLRLQMREVIFVKHCCAIQLVQYL